MARIAGLELNDNWKTEYALTKIKGIGWARSRKILSDSKIANTGRVSALTAEDLASIATALGKYTIEGDLVREVRGNIQRLRDISTYRGVRHARGLPARGQRTKSNARTKRGARKTIGAFKKDMLAKAAPKKEETKK